MASCGGAGAVVPTSVRVGEEQAPALGKFMQAQGVLINASPVVRLVTHLDVNRQQLSEVVAHWQAFLQR
ncbi:hypothetical protein KPZU40_43580 [Klebsiella pneumoniae]|nr:hypothetical protein KPZU40_43580 [Klebsiella pneumoniae]